MVRTTPYARHPKSTRAFTLIELLVVIAVIGTLAALLYGAVNSAVERAKRSSTQALIASVDNAMQLFKTDFGDLPKDDDDYFDANAEVENDPEYVRLWLLGINKEGEPKDDRFTGEDGCSQKVWDTQMWSGPYLEVKLDKQLVKNYEFDGPTGDIDEGEIHYVLIDSWGQRLYYNFYDPTESAPDGRPMFNIEKWDVWSRGPDGLGTISDYDGDTITGPTETMDDQGTSSDTYQERRSEYTEYDQDIGGKTIERVNRDNVANWQ